MVHLSTYQRDVISRYSRLSCILELDTVLAQHNHREAFSSSEVAAAKDRLNQLQEFQGQLNTAWKGALWLMEVLTFARDRGPSTGSGTPGDAMRHLLTNSTSSPATGSEKDPKSTPCIKQSGSGEGNGITSSLKRSLFQLPPRDPKLVKSSASRGSWPGPGVSPGSVACLLGAELSKSEQHLPSQGNRKNSSSSFSNCSGANKQCHGHSGGDISNASTLFKQEAVQTVLVLQV
ncbi:hypothetical protein R5R35_003479 [Gryllus longicercus]|uniref:Uncharacterized protein n=1 Tax=Gryllus longicercus TaxID=2509291 RepID=A0AAN9V964_9ORTH